MVDWPKTFSENYRHSWPTNTLMIANHNPNPSNPTARNMFKDDEKEIMAAAKQNGFRIILKNRHSVHFKKTV